jgi:hypothetical protein
VERERKGHLHCSHKTLAVLRICYLCYHFFNLTHMASPQVIVPSYSAQEDRFIPSRAAMNSELSHFNLTCENATQSVLEDTPQGQYKSALTNSLYNGELDNAKVLAFKAKAPGTIHNHPSFLKQHDLISFSLSLSPLLSLSSSQGQLLHCAQCALQPKPHGQRHPEGVPPPHPHDGGEGVGCPRHAR